jgi:hypothetical protein
MGRPKKTPAAKPAAKSKANGKARSEADVLVREIAFAIKDRYDDERAEGDVAPREEVKDYALSYLGDEVNGAVFAEAWALLEARPDAETLLGPVTPPAVVKTSSAAVRKKAEKKAPPRAAEPDDPFAGEPDGVTEADLGEDYPDDDDIEAGSAEEPDDEAPAGTEYLLHAFTDAEVLQKRLQREALDQQIDQLVADQKVAASEAASLRKQIDAMSKAGREITRSIKSGGEMKYVPCEPRKETSPNLPQAVVDKLGHPPAGELVMVTYRLDTNEAISWRALKPIEKQGQLFGDTAAPTKSNGVEVRTSLGDKLKEAGVTS